MKIAAFLVTYAKPLGAVLYSKALLEALAAFGHEVVVYEDLPSGDRIENGVTVKARQDYRLGSRPGDLVYAHADYGSLPYVASQGHKIPLVYAVHNVSETTAHGLLNWRPDLAIYNAEATAAHFGGLGENGALLRPPLRASVSRSKGRKSSHARSVTLVNLTRDKGAQAFYGLSARLHGLAPFLGVRGGYGIQDERPGIAEIRGPVPHSAMATEVWDHTRVLLMPSAFESWGMVAAEAMSNGIPVVAHPTPGLVECLGKAGIYADREDLDSWESEVRRLLTDAPYYRMASRRARARSREIEQLALDDLNALYVRFAAL